MWFFKKKKDETPEPPSPDEIEALDRAARVMDNNWKRKAQLLIKNSRDLQAELQVRAYLDRQWLQEEIRLTEKGEIQK